jgi:hypothetical protein
MLPGKRWCAVVVLVGVWALWPLARRAAAAEPADTGEKPATDDEAEEKDLAKKIQNPVADLISVPFQNNTTYNIGPNDRAANTLNIQPVIPVHLSEDVLLISRIIVPIVYQPTLTSPGGGSSGVGDTNPTFFLAPANATKFIWGVGPVFLLPTATQTALGTGKWSVGPAAVALVQTKHWTVGALANQVWSFAGLDNRSSVSLMTVQYFVNYNLAHAWYLSSSPILTFNWKASDGNEWTVPFGGGVGKIIKLGKLPLNGQVQAYYNLRSANATEIGSWQVRLQLAFLFPAGKPKPAEQENQQQASAAAAPPAGRKPPGGCAPQAAN